MGYEAHVPGIILGKCRFQLQDLFIRSGQECSPGRQTFLFVALQRVGCQGNDRF
jgi:hypothetical protein